MAYGIHYRIGERTGFFVSKDGVDVGYFRTNAEARVAKENLEADDATAADAAAKAKVEADSIAAQPVHAVHGGKKEHK